MWVWQVVFDTSVFPHSIIQELVLHEQIADWRHCKYGCWVNLVSFLVILIVTHLYWPLQCTGTVSRIPPGHPCFPPQCPGSSAGAAPTDSAEPWGTQQPERSCSQTQWPPSHAANYHFTVPRLLGKHASNGKSMCHYCYRYSMPPLRPLLYFHQMMKVITLLDSL